MTDRPLRIDDLEEGAQAEEQFGHLIAAGLLRDAKRELRRLTHARDAFAKAWDELRDKLLSGGMVVPITLIRRYLDDLDPRKPEGAHLCRAEDVDEEIAYDPDTCRGCGCPKHECHCCPQCGAPPGQACDETCGQRQCEVCGNEHGYHEPCSGGKGLGI